MRTPSTVAEIAAVTQSLIFRICSGWDLEVEISPNKILETARFLVRDLERLVERQGDSVSIYKYAGYWAFWIRKIKPITFAIPSDRTSLSIAGTVRSFDLQHEHTDINERVSLEIAIALIKRHRLENQTSGADSVRAACSGRGMCNGQICLEKFWDQYTRFNDGEFSNYLFYSMRFRTFGPHHYVMLMQSLVFAACKAYDGIR